VPHTTELEQMLECLLVGQEELIAMMKSCPRESEATIKAGQGQMEGLE
jgi:hypothetical protein